MSFRNQNSNASHRPKSDEVRAWSLGLPRLLESRYGTALFRAFLVIEHAEENLDFILKVDKYKTTENLQKRQRMAWDMYRDYIAVGAKHELNLDSMSRKVTTLAMITPHLTTFDTAKARIMNLLSNDAYMRFLNWNIYQDLANQQQHPKNIPETTQVESSVTNSVENIGQNNADSTSFRQYQQSQSGSGVGGDQNNSIPMREFTS